MDHLEVIALPSGASQHAPHSRFREQNHRTSKDVVNSAAAEIGRVNNFFSHRDEDPSRLHSLSRDFPLLQCRAVCLSRYLKRHKLGCSSLAITAMTPRTEQSSEM